MIAAESATAQSFTVFPAPLALTPLPGTHVYLSRNSYLGFAPSGTELYQALLAGNLLTALENLECCCDSAESFAVVGNNPLSYTDPDGLGIFGDIGGIIGSFFPGFGNLIGWGIGSIADLATGQSISPPGFNIGSAIFGSIAGSVNNSQPWNEQLPSGVGSIGGLNTGSVYGSGNVGGMIFSFTDAACNAAYAVDFVKAHIGDAAEVAARLRVPTQNVLGLSAAESRYGLDWNATKVADNGQPAMNFFSLQGNAKSPFANGSVLSGGKTRLSAFPSYKAAAQSFEAQYGGLVTGKVTPVAFATALVPRFNSGKAPLGNPNFIRDLVNTIGMTQRRMGCR